MNVLSIQSAVACGHVGNRAAAFVLQRLGHAVWPIDTVRFSNHPGRGPVRGGPSAWAEMAELLAGLGELGIFADCAAVLSGYLGAADQGAILLDAVRQARQANRQAIWLLDPVIGDRGRIFVREGIPEFIRDIAAPAADILTPNQFELAYLTQRRVDTRAEALAATRALHEKGADRSRRMIVATGLRLADMPVDRLTILAVGRDAAWQMTTPLIDHPAFGAGDVFSALFLGWYLRQPDLASAVQRAVSAVHHVIAHTAHAGATDLLLIETQDELTAPTRLFPLEPAA
ncbi:MAG TPA: pyridoxal kinase [Alphaproteobacteria bacterium]|jgi:pyridoxine kinase|nr:pyridoxal kinase [Alphaproteobacteria bacterium]